MIHSPQIRSPRPSRRPRRSWSSHARRALLCLARCSAWPEALLPTSRLRAYSEFMTVRVVFADDNFLVREGLTGLLMETAGIDLVATVGDPDALLAAVASTVPTPCSPTSGCRLRSPPRASTPRSGSGSSTPTRGSSSSPSTSRRTTPSSCSRTGWPGSATCSRSGSRRSTSWSAHCRKSPAAGPRWTRRWSRG